MPSLFQRFEKWLLLNAFLERSQLIKWLNIGCSYCFLISMSHTKWWSISMFGSLVVTILMAALLSQNIFMGLSLEKSPPRKISPVVWVIFQYSTSALDLVTKFCCLLLPVTRLFPTKVQKPEADLLSRWSPVHCKFVQPTTSLSEVFKP